MLWTFAFSSMDIIYYIDYLRKDYYRSVTHKKQTDVGKHNTLKIQQPENTEYKTLKTKHFENTTPLKK